MDEKLNKYFQIRQNKPATSFDFTIFDKNQFVNPFVVSQDYVLGEDSSHDGSSQDQPIIQRSGPDSDSDSSSDGGQGQKCKDFILKYKL